MEKSIAYYVLSFIFVVLGAWVSNWGQYEKIRKQYGLSWKIKFRHDFGDLLGFVGFIFLIIAIVKSCS